MYKAMDLANYIVNKCINDDKPVNNLQLQTILYYIQKCFLTNWFKKDLIAFDDNIEARSFGPCIPDVYYHFSIYGCMPITENYEHFNIEDDFHKVIIDEVIKIVCNWEPWVRFANTRKENGAWDKVYKNGDGNGNIIPTDFIKMEN